MRMIYLKRGCMLLCILAMFSVLRCEAQASSTATINGTVRDASGAVVPQAAIRVTNESTKVGTSTQSNSDGTFVAPALPIGTYTVVVSKQGFQTYIMSGIKLHPATVSTVNPVMKVGTVKTQVQVTATATMVQTSTPQVSSEVSEQQVGTLPLNGRNFESLTALMPGTVNTQAGNALQPGGRSFRPVMAMNGIDANSVLFLVDGISDTNMNQNTIIPNPDTIAEVRVLQNSYEPKYTFLGTGVALIETKSGTRSFHGSAFEYLRNDKLDARNFFASDVSPLKQNIFGYTLGGPVYIPKYFNTKKEKTFFFWSQQWVVAHAGTVARGATPTADMRSGIFTQPIVNPQTGQPFPEVSPGEYQIPSTMLNSNSLAFMNALYPLPNNPSGGFLNYINDKPQITNQRDDEIKVDHFFASKFRLTGEYLDERQTLDTPSLSVSGSPFTTNHEIDYTRNQLAQLQLVSTLSPSVVNTTSISMNNFVLDLNVVGKWLLSDVPDFHSQLPFNGFLSDRLPRVSFTGGWAGQGIHSARPLTHAADLKDTFSDDISWLRGNHLIEGGLQMYWQTKRQNAPGALGSNGQWTFDGQFTGNPIADFLLGYASSFGQSATELRPYVQAMFVSPYVQDRWKARRNLTLSLGLRVSFMPNAHPQRGYETLFVPSEFDPAQAPVVNADGTITPGPNYNPLNGLVPNGEKGWPLNWSTRHQWFLAPMFGFAWDVFGNGKTSLRGGYGIINTNRFTTEDCSYACASNPPGNTSITLINPSFPSPVGTGTAAPLGAPSLRSQSLDLQPYQLQSYSLSLEHEFPRGWLASIAGAGTIGRHLQGGGAWNINQPPPDPPYDFNPIINTGTVFPYVYGPYQGYGSISMSMSAENLYWNALELSVRHPVGHNLFISAAYTWSHDLSNRDTVLDTYNPNRYYGNVPGLNVPQVFSGSVIWSLPWKRNATGIGGLLGGWKLSDITLIQTGSSMSPGLGIAHQGLAVRPNLVSSLQGPKTVNEWFNTQAFAAPAPGYFGNAGTGTILGPGLVNFDMAFYKDFRITERQTIEFRSELFNIFNHTNFSGVSTTFGAGNFGKLTSAKDPRIAEFALRYRF